MSDRDRRTYIKLHDGMPEHPKVDGLSDKAFRVLIETWCWCARNLTDGYIPLATWRKRCPARVSKELVAAGLVEEAADGVQMHDYLQHQTSRAQVEHVREVRSQAGKRGGRPRKPPTAKANGNQVASPAGGESGGAEPGGHQPNRNQLASGLTSNAEARPEAEKTQKTEDRRTTETPDGVSAATSRSAARPIPAGTNVAAQRITRVYYEREPLSKFPAVMAVVKRALAAGRHSEDQITAALLRMADEGRTVTVDALRTELDGFPASRGRSLAAVDRRPPPQGTASQRAQTFLDLRKGTPA